MTVGRKLPSKLSFVFRSEPQAFNSQTALRSRSKKRSATSQIKTQLTSDRNAGSLHFRDPVEGNVRGVKIEFCRLVQRPNGNVAG